MLFYKDIIQDINDLQGSYWIKANAGCGKTTKLIGRIIFLLENGVKPENILCITYTHAGADEMKKRIVEKLNQEGIKKMLQSKNIIVEPERIQISTIHGFCQFFLQQKQFLSNDVSILNLDFRKKDKITNLVLNKVLKNKSLNFLIEKMAEIMGLQDLHSLVQDIINKQNIFRSLSPVIFEKSADVDINVLKKELINLVPNGLKWLVDLDIEKMKMELTEKIDKISSFDISVLLDGVFKSGSDNNESYKKEILENPTELEVWKSAVFSIDKPRSIKAIQKVQDDNLKSLWFDIRKYFAYQNNKISADMTINVLILAYEVLKEYERIKKDMQVMTYDDMLYETYKMSLNGELPKIDYIMLDEAQDTNPFCWKIIEKFKNHNNKPSSVFVVGDVKQSIYSFQGADLKYYDKYYNIFKAKYDKQHWHDDIELSKSKRSVINILDIANFLCGNVKDAFGQEQIRHDTEKLGRIEQRKHFFNYQLLQEKQDEEDRNKDNYFSWLLERDRQLKIQEKELNDAINFANLIKKIHKEDETTAIIVPKRNTKNGFVFDIIDELQKEVDISLAPEFAVKNLHFKDLLAILQFSILEIDDFNLACVLKSDFLNWSDEDLEKVCNKNDSLLNNIKKQQFDKTKNTISFLDKILSFDCISELLSFLEEENKKQGKQYGKHLALLHDMLQSYLEQGGSDYDFRDFIFYVDQGSYSNKEKSREIKKGLYFGTIHGVKGLEFDNVVLLDFENDDRIMTNKMLFFNQTNDDKNNIFLYKEKNIINFDDFSIDALNNEDLKTIQMYIQEIHMDEQMEKLRLLYVAITRARNNFYYIGNMEQKKIKGKKGLDSNSFQERVKDNYKTLYGGFFDLYNSFLEKGEKVDNL